MPQFISQQDARSARPNPVADITISVLKQDLFTWRSFWMLIVARGLDRLLADRSTPSLPWLPRVLLFSNAGLRQVFASIIVTVAASMRMQMIGVPWMNTACSLRWRCLTLTIMCRQSVL